MIRLMSFGRAVQEFIRAGAPAVSPAEYADRIAACESCDQRRGARCKASSCECWIWSKAIDQRQACPLGKWD